MSSSKAFTIAELLVASAIILLTSLAILFTYTQCLELHSLNQNTALALESARNTMETVKTARFDQIYDLYNGMKFPLKGLQGIGTVEVDNKNPQFLGITVRAFWKQKGRIIGEDQNLDGRVDDEEDSNHNGRADSPVCLFTYIGKR